MKPVAEGKLLEEILEEVIDYKPPPKHQVNLSVSCQCLWFFF